MAANLTTFDGILKDFYVGPVIEELNQEVFVLDHFEKATVQWNGRRAILPVHVARNSGVGYAADGASLPAAGQQGWEDLQVSAANLYGRFQITGPAISAARTGGTNAFISYVDAEMDHLKKDVRDRANRSAVSGGRVVGFINQKKDGGVAEVWQFAGDHQKVTDAIAARGAAVACQFIRCDTYAIVDTDNVSAATAPTASAMATITVDTALDTRPVPDGVAIAVRISDADASLDYLDNESLGIYGNLFERTHFGVDRTDATGTATALQSQGFTQGTATPDAGAALSLARIQAVMDNITLESGQDCDLMMMSPLQRSRYVALLTGTLSTGSGVLWSDAGKSDKTGDGGFTSLGYAGVPIYSSRHVDQGLIIFMRSDSWCLLEKEPMAFADLDGAVLSRVSGVDAFEGYIRWYYNLCAKDPGANAILCGLLP